MAVNVLTQAILATEYLNLFYCSEICTRTTLSVVCVCVLVRACVFECPLTKKPRLLVTETFTNIHVKIPDFFEQIFM